LCTDFRNSVAFLDICFGNTLETMQWCSFLTTLYSLGLVALTTGQLTTAIIAVAAGGGGGCDG